MADGVPLYNPAEQFLRGEPPSLQPQALPPSGGGGERIGTALGEFGKAGASLAQTFAHMRDQTEVATSTGKYLTKLEELERTFDKDPDYKTSRERFDAQRTELEREYAGEITSDHARQMATLRWQQAGTAAGKRISHAALGREQDANLASHTVIENSTLRDAADAAPGSPERQAAIDRMVSSTTSMTAAGWMHEQVAAQRMQQWNSNLDKADVIRDMRLDPVGTKAKLEDPKYAPALDPVTRENFKNNAANHSDQVKIDYALTLPPAEARKYIGEQDLQPHNYYRAIQQVETHERQEEARQDRAASKAASAARDQDPMIEIAKQGFPIDPAREENWRNLQLRAAERGDVKAAEALHEYDLVKAFQPYKERAYAMAPVVLDNNIAELEGKMRAPGGNVTRDDVYALKAYKAVREEITKRRNTEPILLGAEGGARYYELGPLDPNAPLAEIRDELAARNGKALVANQQWGGNGSALTELQAAGMKARWDKAGPEERFQILTTLADALPSKTVYEGTLSEVVGKNPTMATVGRLALERPDLAKEYLRGARILEDPRAAEKAGLVRHELASNFGSLIYPDPKMQQQWLDIAVAVHASRRAGSGELYEPTATSGLRGVAEEISGPIHNVNGIKTPTPPAIARGDVPGIREADFRRTINNLTEADVSVMGGAMDGQTNLPIPASHLRNAVFRPLAIGGDRYTVEMPIGEGKYKPVLTADGNVMIFNARQVALGHKADEARAAAVAPPTPGAVARSTRAAAILDQPAPGKRQPTPPPAPPSPEPRPERDIGELGGRPPGYPGIEE